MERTSNEFVLDNESESNGDTSLVPAAADAPAVHRPLTAVMLLWQQRRFLLRVLGVALVLTTLIAFLIPKRYDSTTQLMPPDTQASGISMLAALAGGGGSGLGALAGDLLGAKTSGALFVGVLRSRTVQDRLINKFDLRKVYYVKRYEDARKILTKKTDIREDRKSGIVTVTVTDSDPVRAEKMAQAYVDELDVLVAQLSTSAAHRERVFIEDRLKVVKQELDNAARQFSEFSSKNTAIDIKEQGKAMLEAAATLQGQLIAAESELKGLQQIYTDDNIRVRSVKARISELQRQLEKMGGGAMGTRPESGSAVYPSIRQLPVLGVTYADLYRQTKIEEAVYEALTKEYEMARVQEAKEIPSVRVLDQAVVPEKKSFPPRMLIISLGTIAAFCFGMVWVLAEDFWKQVDYSNPWKMFLLEVSSTVRQDPRLAKLALYRPNRLSLKLLHRVKAEDPDQTLDPSK